MLARRGGHHRRVSARRASRFGVEHPRGYDTLLDEQRLKRPRTRSGERLAGVRDRRVRVVVVVSHSASSSQCSKTST